MRETPSLTLLDARPRRWAPQVVARPFELKQATLGDDADDDVGGGRGQSRKDEIAMPDVRGSLQEPSRRVTLFPHPSLLLTDRIDQMGVSRKKRRKVKTVGEMASCGETAGAVITVCRFLKIVIKVFP